MTSNVQKCICSETAENFGTIQWIEDTVKPVLQGNPLLCAHLLKSRKTIPKITIKPMVWTSYFFIVLAYT